jgi:hypothetical protein
MLFGAILDAMDRGTRTDNKTKHCTRKRKNIALESITIYSSQHIYCNRKVGSAWEYIYKLIQTPL